METVCCSLNSAEEAREMYSHARHYGRGVALAYIASAQFEVSQGMNVMCLNSIHHTDVGLGYLLLWLYNCNEFLLVYSFFIDYCCAFKLSNL